MRGNLEPLRKRRSVVPKVLRQIVLDCIKNHVPDDLHQERLVDERDDRELIADLVAGGPSDFAWDPMTEDDRESAMIAESDRRLAELDRIIAELSERDGETD